LTPKKREALHSRAVTIAWPQLRALDASMVKLAYPGHIWLLIRISFRLSISAGFCGLTKVEALFTEGIEGG
jgi:hypothetical protein